MKQLSGLDATFLYMETPSQFGHVSSLSIFQRPDDPNYEPFAAWRSQIECRIHLLEPLRRKLRDVPMHLDHPFWVDDDEFDLDFHVRNTAIPPPGSDAQLADVVARIVGRPLDRTRPLWETYVIEGLPDDRFGILTKVHHATVDGASGAELLTLMLDSIPEGDELSEVEEWIPERPPSDAEVLVRALTNLARKPGRALVLSARTARELGRATRNPALTAAANQMRNSLRGPLGTALNFGRERSPETDVKGPLPSLSSPSTPFNAPITPHRRFAFRSASLESVKGIKNALGATVNDVVMAVCAGGLRTWLEQHEALPDKPLGAMIPVSIRTGEETEKWTNRVSAIFASLPTDEPDPVKRVERVHDAMANAKELFDAIPADALTDFAQFPPPAVFARAMRMATRLSARVSAPVNLVISNVPGPREPLYAAGSKLLHYYPVSTIVDGQGLNVTVQSYLDTLDFGLVSCRELVPDLWDMLDAILDDLAALGKATGVDVAL
ncbi:MAG TPA: wax ester/triacylglycerol synthase family O-acyltransferase [Acidimicrobiales bacterium]|jgi:WS/DGAT/MGAT family acyltransferase|nr:wax ester/triacylglycerol synthase family O-acyltransferase [Acidimicrobiales bacterium]